jgi:hypothetical protein
MNLFFARVPEYYESDSLVIVADSRIVIPFLVLPNCCSGYNSTGTKANPGARKTEWEWRSTGENSLYVLALNRW